jgi:mannose-6-phosphate isomerase-like protein (cupin superfamily)
MGNQIQTNELAWSAGKVKGFLGKNLIDIKNGGLKKVLVEAGADYPVHLHPDKTEFIYVLSGQPTITIGEEIFSAIADDFYILPAGIMHSIKNEKKEACQLLVGSILN